jgi:hypothetical protein
MTTSGVARGKNRSRLIPERILNWYLPSAIAIMVPKIVETIVATVAINIEFPKATQTSGMLQTPIQFFRVKPRQMVFDLKVSLNEKTKV